MWFGFFSQQDLLIAGWRFRENLYVLLHLLSTKQVKIKMMNMNNNDKVDMKQQFETSSELIFGMMGRMWCFSRFLVCLRMSLTLEPASLCQKGALVSICKRAGFQGAYN